MANEFDIDNLRLELLANQSEAPISTFTQKSVDPSYNPLENPDAADEMLRFINMATTQVDLGPISDILKPFAKGIHATGRGLEAIGDIARKAGDLPGGSDIHKGLIDATVGTTDFLLAEPLQHILGPEGEISLLEAALFAPGGVSALKAGEKALGAGLRISSEVPLKELLSLKKVASGLTSSERRSQLLGQIDDDIGKIYKHYTSDKAYKMFSKNYSDATAKSISKEKYKQLVDAQFKGELLSSEAIIPGKMPTMSDVSFKDLGHRVAGSFSRLKKGINLKDQYIELSNWMGNKYGLSAVEAAEVAKLNRVASTAIHEWTHMIHTPKEMMYFTELPSFINFQKKVRETFRGTKGAAQKEKDYVMGLFSIVQDQQNILRSVHKGASKQIMPFVKKNKQIQSDIEKLFEHRILQQQLQRLEGGRKVRVPRPELKSDEAYYLGYQHREIPIELISDDLLNKMAKKYRVGDIQRALRFLERNQDEVYMGEVMARLSEIRHGPGVSGLGARFDLSTIFKDKDIDKMLDSVWGAAPVMGMGSLINE